MAYVKKGNKAFVSLMCPYKKKNPVYTGFIVAGAGLEPTTFGL